MSVSHGIMKPVRAGSVCLGHPCVPTHGTEQTLETWSVKLNQNNVRDANRRALSHGRKPLESGSPQPQPQCQLLQEQT